MWNRDHYEFSGVDFKCLSLRLFNFFPIMSKEASNLRNIRMKLCSNSFLRFGFGLFFWGGGGPCVGFFGLWFFFFFLV